MATAKVLKMDGAEAGTVDLPDAVYAVEMNDALVHDAVVALQAARRQGNAETKTRSDVRGGGQKPYRQKGTGNARHGSIREPQMRGGGTVFGPHKRSYRQKVTPRARRQALCMALSARLRDEALCVLDALALDAPKTKVFAGMLDAVVPDGRRTVVVVPEADEKLLLSARNVKRATVRRAMDLSVLDVLEARRVVIVQDALPVLEQRLAAAGGAKEAV
jgi:large subunit ribosomal protein L4